MVEERQERGRLETLQVQGVLVVLSAVLRKGWWGRHNIWEHLSLFSLSPSLFYFNSQQSMWKGYRFFPWIEKEHVLKSQSFAGQKNSSLPSSKEKLNHLQDLHRHTQKIWPYRELTNTTIKEFFSPCRIHKPFFALWLWQFLPYSKQ